MTEEDLEAQEGTKEVWYKVAEADALQDGEVRAVQAGTQIIALTCHRGEIGALDNACPHHSNLGLADALRLQEEQGNLKSIGIRHEGAAAFAASGDAKLCGKPAASMSIAGPDATNMLTGLWDAKVDRAPILALTGQVNTQVLGPGAFQEIDLASAFGPVARFSQTVLRDSNHVELMNLACKTARVERDVAHLIFPDEVQTRWAGPIQLHDREENLSD
ncbi:MULTISPECIES: thiamine pyrophosphate-binding protein [unclassified Thiocapsa]|uniref:thiamine pyrophosphate-binding protein n=1 Tax=unclassified Thiocapsa TaxID=2641286 RepID=UPI0035AF5268